MNGSSNSGKKVERSKGDSTNGPLPQPPAARGRVLRATILFVVLLGLFYAFIHSPSTGGTAWQPYLKLHTSVVAGLLNGLGSGVHVDGTTIIGQNFAMEIVRGCDGIEPVAVYVSAVLASPVRVVARLYGALGGAIALIIINWLRLVMLYFAGVYWRSIFDLLHESIWQAVFIGLAIVFWAFWVDFATRTPKAADHALA